MNQKKLGFLVLALLLLVVVYALLQSGDSSSSDSQRVDLLKDVKANTDAISKVVIDSGSESVELASQGEAWVVPSRGNYPANSGRMRSLLLKLVELSVTQKITSNEKRFAGLGVAEESLTKGSTRIRFYGKDGKETAALILGEMRKARPSDEMGGAGSSGQYVRRLNSPDVYLIGEPITAGTKPESWIDVDLINVSQSRIREMTQYSVSGDKAVEQFTLVRKKPGAEGPNFVPKGGVKADQEIQDAVVSQAGAGLEFLKLEDVVPQSEAATKLAGANFDRKTVYETDSGLEYTVLTAEKDGKYYLKISAAFMPELAKSIAAEIQKANDDAKQEYDAQVKELEKSDPKAAKPDAPQELKAELSSEEDARKFNERHGPWTYAVAKFSADRFRRSEAELTKPKKAAEPEKK